MNPSRQEQLLNWLRSVLNDSTIQKLQPASSDASFRSYHRIDSRGTSLVVMDAPPEHEDVRPWLAVNQRLRAANLSAPEVMAANPEHGFVLMGDLGDTPYLDVLDASSRDQLYGDALDALLRMQTVTDASGLPEYDAVRLRQELDLFPDWFIRRHLGIEPDAAALALIERCFARLIESALEQPQVFVHRDYHSRNLMRIAHGNPGIIDFQDAVRGPITYDLVSLLRDCYIAWPEAEVQALANQYRDRLARADRIGERELRFKRWFDFMGLQRHLKVLGIFCRLHYRDGKPQYLADLPLTLKYVLEVAGRSKELAPFAGWLAAQVGATDLTRPRAGASAQPA